MQEQGARPISGASCGSGARGLRVRPESKGWQQDEKAKATIGVRSESAEQWRLLRPESKPTRRGRKNSSSVWSEIEKRWTPAIRVSKDDLQDRGVRTNRKTGERGKPTKVKVVTKGEQ